MLWHKIPKYIKPLSQPPEDVFDGSNDSDDGFDSERGGRFDGGSTGVLRFCVRVSIRVWGCMGYKRKN